MKKSIIILVLAICVNTAVHFFYAPYREYKEMFKILNSNLVQSNQNLRNEVRDMIIPSFTNQIQMIENRQLNKYLSLSSSGSFTTTEFVVSSNATSVVQFPFSSSAYVFQSGSNWFIYDSPFVYKRGDRTHSGIIENIWKGGFQIGGKTFGLGGFNNRRSAASVSGATVRDTEERRPALLKEGGIK